MSETSKPGTVLVVSNIAWDFVWQRHQTMAALFAAAGHQVLFCELPGIRRVGWRDTLRLISRGWRLVAGGRGATGEPSPPGVQVLRPWTLPATNALFRAWNARQLDRFVARRPELGRGVALALNYSPTRTALQLLDRVPHRRLVYDCTNDWLSVAGVPASLAADERELLARADLTLVSGEELRRRKTARRLAILREGVLIERFTGIAPAPRDGPVTLLYYGHLHRQHLDFAAIEALASQRPAWRIILVGPVKTPHRFPDNVRLHGPRRHTELRTEIAAAHALLLPYVLNDYTRCVFPAKTYECLATGRPVVATPLPALTGDLAGHLTLASSPEEWPAAVERALAADSEAARAGRLAVARANTWAQRFAELQALLAGLEKP